MGTMWGEQMGSLAVEQHCASTQMLPNGLLYVRLGRRNAACGPGGLCAHHDRVGGEAFDWLRRRNACRPTGRRAR